MSVSVEDILFEAKLALRLQDFPDHDSYMDILLDRAVRHLDNVDTFEDCIYTFDVTSNTVKLPRGFKQWQGLRFIELVNEEQDQNLFPVIFPQVFNQTIYVDYLFLNSCEVTDQELQQAGALPYTTVCKIKGDYIVFNTNITSLYAKGQLAYKGLATNSDGRLLVKDDYTRAITSYICWKFAQAYPERYTRDIREEWRAEWTAQKSWLKGQASVENFRRNQWVISNIMRKIRVNTI